MPGFSRSPNRRCQAVSKASQCSIPGSASMRTARSRSSPARRSWARAEDGADSARRGGTRRRTSVGSLGHRRHVSDPERRLHSRQPFDAGQRHRDHECRRSGAGDPDRGGGGAVAANTAGVAYGHAHRLASSEKQRHEMAADETGSAEHRDSAGHGSSPSSRRCWRSHQSIPATTRSASSLDVAGVVRVISRRTPRGGETA